MIQKVKHLKNVMYLNILCPRSSVNHVGSFTDNYDKQLIKSDKQTVQGVNVKRSKKIC